MNDLHLQVVFSFINIWFVLVQCYIFAISKYTEMYTTKLMRDVYTLEEYRGIYIVSVNGTKINYLSKLSNEVKQFFNIS